MPELMRLMLTWTVDTLVLPLMALALGVHMPISYWLVGTFFAFAAARAVISIRMRSGWAAMFS